jgi:hypothetical protein
LPAEQTLGNLSGGMREAAGIWPKPIVDRWASLADVARGAARLVDGPDVG